MPTPATAPIVEFSSLHSADLGPDECGGSLPPAALSPTYQPILVSVRFMRAKGQAKMIVDARALHTYLQRIGVETQTDAYTGTTMFKDRPSQSYKSVNPSRLEISSEALLRLEGPHEYNLLEVFSTPPTGEALRLIGASVHKIVDAVVDHYRPIEISVVVHEKGGK